MKHFTLVLMFAGALLACGGKKANKDTVKIEAWADQMCACKDAACAQKIMEEMAKDAEADKRPLSERIGDEAAQKAFGVASKRITECSMKANGM